MKTEEVIDYLEKLASKAEQFEKGAPEIFGILIRAREFLRVHVGNNSEFYSGTLFLDESNLNGKALANILRNLQEYINDGFSKEFTPLQQAQINVVSDFFDQARLLVNDKKVHPAAACMIIGATLEEFLRNWVERKSLKLGNRKPGIVAYAEILLGEKLLTKLDHKDILAWAGLRNEAAHGKWEELKDRERAKIMLDGVNLFPPKIFRAVKKIILN